MNYQIASRNLQIPSPQWPSRLARFAPAIVALSLSWSASSAFATPQQGQTAINNQLANFFQNQNVGTVQKTTLTATADELIAAVAAALINGTSNAVDLAGGALLAATPPGKTVAVVRADKDKVAGRLVSTILASVDPTATTTIGNVLGEALSANDLGSTTQNKLELTSAGRALAVAAALKFATAANAGSTIADKALAVVSNSALLPAANTTALQAFTIATLKSVGANTNEVKSFVSRVINAPTDVVADNQTFVINVAKGVIINPSAAGEVIGGAAVGRSDTGNGSITTLAQAAISNPALAKAIAQIAGSTAAEYLGTKASFAADLAVNQTKAATRGLIAAGVIHAAANVETNGILSAARGANVTAINDVILFGSAAVTNNTGEKARLITVNVATPLDDLNRTKLGAAMVKVVAVTTPEAAGNVTQGLLDVAPSFAGDKTFLAQNLAKAAPTNNIAVGSIAATVAAATGFATVDQKAKLAADVIKVASKAATGVAMKVSALSQITDQADFAKRLALLARTSASAIAVGVSQTAPTKAESITSAVVLLADPLTGKALNVAIAPTIAGAVALSVDVEKAADIAFTLSGEMTATGVTAIGAPKKLKLSQATTLATAVAKAINTKPFVTTSNRSDEFGELAASIVGQVLGKSAGATQAVKDAAEFKLITAIGTAVIKALAAKQTPNNANLAADQREAADIAGSIAQTIAVSSLADAQKKVLLGITLTGTATVGALEKALTAAVANLPKRAANVPSVVTANKDAVTAAFLAVRTAYNLNPANPIVSGTEGIGTNGVATKVGKYEIGSVNDPETPVLNI